MYKIRIFNASGHPIASSDTVEVVDSVAIPNIDLGNPQAVIDAAMEIAEEAGLHVLEGCYIALPGMSVLAAAVLAAIHGKAGQFPKIAYAVRGDDGVFRFGAGQEIDLWRVRMDARAER